MFKISCVELIKKDNKMKIIELEDWQVKNLREYFGKNDSTQTSHWAFPIFDKAHKQQLNLNRSSLQLKEKIQTELSELKNDLDKYDTKLNSTFSKKSIKFYEQAIFITKREIRLLERLIV